MTLRRGQHWSIVVTCCAVAFGCSSLDSGTSFSETPPMNAGSGAGTLGASGGAPQLGSTPQGGGGTEGLDGVDGGGGATPPVPGGTGNGGAPSVAGAGAAASGMGGMTGAAGGSAEGGSGHAGSAAGSGGSGSGGTGSAGGGASTPVAFAEVKTILDRSCSGSLGCHGQLGRRPSLRSSDANLYETLRTVTVARCGGDKLVVPGSPSESALVEVVSGGCGSLRMPPSCSSTACLPSADLMKLKQWVESGAPEN